MMYQYKYDDCTANADKMHRERLYLYNYYDGICQTCGERLGINDFTIAHKIADSKCNRHRFGKWVVNSRANLRPTHRGACNDAQNCGNNPAKSAEIVEAAKLERGKA
jgi:hypothetical protein